MACGVSPDCLTASVIAPCPASVGASAGVILAVDSCGIGMSGVGATTFCPPVACSADWSTILAVF